jgi:acetyltransferase
MTIRNLDALFEPKSIALVGASNQPGSVGAVLARNLLDTGFSGPIFPVNPHEQSIRSTLNYRTVAELPLTPDLAVIATPPATVPGLVAELAGRGCRAAVIITAGFSEGGSAEGKRQVDTMLAAAGPSLMRILGPNCLGFISPARGINASFAHLTPTDGSVAFLSQSGALATAILDWAKGRNFGFSHVVSLGDMADIDFGDLLDYLALDQKTHAILLYVESITHARKFMSAARVAARSKPVIVIKSGSSNAGAKAAMSHTGALAGADLVYDAAFRRAGTLRVHELRELFEAVTTLSSGIDVDGDRLTIVTNGGGAGVLAADALEERGGRLADLSPELVASLSQSLPKAWSHGNPVDIIGDADGKRYAAAMQVLAANPATDAMLVLNCPTAVADSTEAARAVAANISENTPPVLTCWLGDEAARAGRALFTEHRIPTYETPDEAVRAFMHLVDYRRNQDALLQTPPSPTAPPIGPGPRELVHGLIGEALKRGTSLLSEPDSKAILAAYGIPTVATRAATSVEDAVRLSGDMKFPVVLKILSPDISHKSDVGGVKLDLESPEAVGRAATEMLETVGKHAPNAHLAGFVVEEMIRRPAAHELLLGIGDDRLFGPIILFGQGGTAAEIIRDRAIGLPPLNEPLAREMIQRTRIARLLAGYRDRPPVDMAALAGTLVALSNLVIDCPEIAELDINPLLADDHGVIALDARIVVRAAPPESRFAIRPYPIELDRQAVIEGHAYRVRPVKPEDEPALVDMLRRSSPEDVRMRFLRPLRELPHALAARLSQIDYDREMALVAEPLGGSAQREIHGVARLAADPDGTEAEFAVMVRSDLAGHGIGRYLMTELLAYADRRGIERLTGEVYLSNRPLLNLAESLGFRIASDDGHGIAHIVREKAGAAS